MRYMGLIGILYAGLGMAADPSSKKTADDRPAELVKAITAYEDSRDKANDDLLRAFDAVADRLSQRKLSLDERLKSLDVIKSEKERFQKQGLIPWSQPMWPYLGVYQKNLIAAEARLRQAYANAIDRALRARDTDSVNHLRGELAAVIEVKVVAKWRHRFGEGPRDMALYSNGRIGAADSSANWTFQSGVLILYWPDTRAPGGAWKDVCRMAPDGLTYSGKRNDGRAIGGHQPGTP